MTHEKCAARTCTENMKADLLFKHDFNLLYFTVGQVK